MFMLYNKMHITGNINGFMHSYQLYQFQNLITKFQAQAMNLVLIIFTTYLVNDYKCIVC